MYYVTVIQFESDILDPPLQNSHQTRPSPSGKPSTLSTTRRPTRRQRNYITRTRMLTGDQVRLTNGTTDPRQKNKEDRASAADYTRGHWK